MLKNLFSALFRRQKKTMTDPTRTEPHLQTPRAKPKLPEPRQEELRMLQPQVKPKVTKKAAPSVAPSQPARHDDSLANPTHPLSPLNPIHSDALDRRADAWIESRCDDSPRSSSGYLSSCSSSSSYSESSSSSSCD